MATLSRHQLRAARALLVLNQEHLAGLAGVGVTTIRKFENGYPITAKVERALRAAIEAEGAILVDPGTVVGEATAGHGVVLRDGSELPPGTRQRIANVDQAAALMPDAGSTARKRGKRARVTAEEA